MYAVETLKFLFEFGLTVPDPAKVTVDPEDGNRRLALVKVADRVQLVEALQQLVDLVFVGRRLALALALEWDSHV